MDPLETLLGPVTGILNRNIRETTPARELCEQLDGTTIAVRVRNTGLAMYYQIDDEVITLTSEAPAESDVVISGSLLTLARMLLPDGASFGEAALRDGSLDLTGDAETAEAFSRLINYAKPDIEEELSAIIGDAASHQLGQLARGIGRWSVGARETIHENIREYLQEESGTLPSRYEVERFTRKVDALRDDVERLEARLNRLANGS